MRHLKAGRRLGVTTSHRRAMMRNLVTSLVEHEQITCTLARAKELRKPLDKMITLGKRGNLHARRQALKFVKSKKAMAALFGELAERYKDRNGGYSRIIRLGTRRLGDGAEMAVIQLIDGPNDVLSGAKKKPFQKKARPSTEILEEVSQEISTEPSQNIEKIPEEPKEVSEETVQEESRETSETPQEVVEAVSEDAEQVSDDSTTQAQEPSESIQETEEPEMSQEAEEKNSDQKEKSE